MDVFICVIIYEHIPYPTNKPSNIYSMCDKTLDGIAKNNNKKTQIKFKYFFCGCHSD